MIESREYVVFVLCCDEKRLTTETVQSAALSFESVDDVKGGDGLALGVLGICDCVTDDSFEEGLEDTACLFVDHWGEALVCYVVAGKCRWEGTYWLRYA